MDSKEKDYLLNASCGAPVSLLSPLEDIDLLTQLLDASPRLLLQTTELGFGFLIIFCLLIVLLHNLELECLYHASLCRDVSLVVRLQRLALSVDRLVFAA